MKIYHPFLFEDVDASSPPHPPETKYRVSIGIEYWQDNPIEVSKVQMVYDGVVSGRRSPSYPAGTDDFQKVTEAFHRLQEKANKTPMTWERFRAFSPDSPAAKALQDEKKQATASRIMERVAKAKLKKVP